MLIELGIYAKSLFPDYILPYNLYYVKYSFEKAESLFYSSQGP